MKRYRGLLFVVAGLIVLPLTVAFSRGGQVLAEIKPLLVQVINTAANPVPITGSTTVNGTVQSQIVNTSNNPVPITGNIAAQIADPALNAYQDRALSSIAENAFVSGVFFGKVPEGKRLVIQSISIRVEVPLGQVARAKLITHLNGQTASFSIPLTSQGSVAGFPADRDAFVGISNLTIYQDGGSGFGINIDRSSSSGSGEADATISGYLVDLP